MTFYRGLSWAPRRCSWPLLPRRAFLALRRDIAKIAPPHAHQDDRNGRTLLAMLRAAADDGAAVLIASRSPGVVEAVADRTVALSAPVHADR